MAEMTKEPPLGSSSGPGPLSGQAMALAVSATINCCIFLHVTFLCAVRALRHSWNKAEILRDGKITSKQTTRFEEMWRRGLAHSDSELSHTMTRAVSSLFLLTCSIYFLLGTSVVWYPFKVAAQDRTGATVQEASPLLLPEEVSLLCAVALGYVVYCTAREALHPWGALRQPSGLVQLLYNLVCVACYISVLVTKENLILGVICVLLEGDYVARRLLQRSGESDKAVVTHAREGCLFYTEGKRCPRGWAAVAGTLVVIIRILAPVAVMVFSFSNQAILKLSPYSLSLLFCTIVFLLMYNCGVVMVDVCNARWRRDFIITRKAKYAMKGGSIINSCPPIHMNNNNINKSTRDSRIANISLSSIPHNLLENGLLKADTEKCLWNQLPEVITSDSGRDFTKPPAQSGTREQKPISGSPQCLVPISEASSPSLATHSYKQVTNPRAVREKAKQLRRNPVSLNTILE